MRPIEVLEESIQKNQIAHAILLEGGNSKLLRNTAELLAGQILKTEFALTHPDCFTLRPSGRSRYIRIGKKEDRNKGIWPENTMRRLIDDLQKTANQGGPKVAIIYEAERMNKESANAFLKTLEEPPKDTILFLLTERSYDLIDTIRSRCLTYRIPSETVLDSLGLWGFLEAEVVLDSTFLNYAYLTSIFSNADSISWDFGDPLVGSSSDSLVTAEYLVEGEYTVTLSVYDRLNCESKSVNTIVQIQVPSSIDSEPSNRFGQTIFITDLLGRRIDDVEGASQGTFFIEWDNLGYKRLIMKGW